MLFLLAGSLTVYRHDGFDNSARIVTLRAGQFSGEVGQLSDRPAMADGVAGDGLHAVVLTSAALRALTVAHADLGERLIRALILRCVLLLEENSGGPVIIGPRGHGRVHTLQSFLTANAHPCTVLDPLSDERAAALAEPYRPTAEDWPLVVCPGIGVKKNPSVVELGRCIGMLRELSEDTVWDVIVV